MTKVLKKLATILVLISTPTYAGPGPTNIGNIQIGMTKADYLEAIWITPLNCNVPTEKKGQFALSELKDIDPDEKFLCKDLRKGAGKTGTIENIKIENISYDVIRADYDSSTFIRSLGNESEAIFIDDKLVSFTIVDPKVTLDTLSIKYGTPKTIADKTLVEVCTNKIGNQVKNDVGTVDAIWVNGGINAIYRITKFGPDKTCTDTLNKKRYILEDRAKVTPIESAISVLRRKNDIEKANESPF